jgi:small conductance mechanosensitive channel
MENFDWTALYAKAIDMGILYGKKILIALLIYIVGIYIIRWIKKLVEHGVEKAKYDPAIKGFTISLISILLKVLLIIAIVGTLGVETTSISALLASAGIAVGMALSGSLQNFAGGFMILLLRPFRVGDFIETNGQKGTVQTIQIFNTIMTTLDNKTIIIPNAKISNDILTNYTHQETRRVDLTIGVDYGTEYEKVVAVIDRLVIEDKRILRDPSYFVGLGNLNDSSIDFTLRMWVKSADYWGVYFDMTQKIYAEFNKEGIEFPFPQLTIHQAKN